MKDRKKFLGAGVLFIAALMFLSSAVVVANTEGNELEIPTAIKDTKYTKNTEKIAFENAINVADRGVKCYGCNLHNDPNDNLVWFDSTTPGTFNDIADISSTDFLSGGCFVGDIWWVCEYSADNSNVYTINTITGDMTLIGPSGVSLNGLAYDPSTDTLYGCGSTDLFIINQGNGDSNPIGPFNTGGLMIGIACDMNGKMYGEDLGTDNLYEINTNDGSATLIGAIGIALNYAQDIAYDKINDVLYSTGYKGSTNGGGAFGTLDLTDGHYTLIGDFPIGNMGCPSEVDALAIPYTVQNQPPGITTIDGPADGDAGDTLTYTFKADDPDLDNVKFIIDWGDSNTDTTGFVASGATETADHVWTAPSTYIITAYAEDTFGNTGPTATFTVTIPRNKVVSTHPFITYLQNHPYMFPLMQKLITQLGLY